MKIGKLLSLIDGSDVASEKDSGRDGLLSYSAEWHAAILGLSLGIAARSSGDLRLMAGFVFAVLGVAKAKRSYNKKALREAKREPWYALGGVMIGFVVGTLLTGGGSIL